MSSTCVTTTGICESGIMWRSNKDTKVRSSIRERYTRAGLGPRYSSKFQGFLTLQLMAQCFYGFNASSRYYFSISEAKLISLEA